jgi:hypothetical protein
MSERFPEVAQRAFSFLADTGFSLTSCDAHRVQFDAPKAFLTIEWDPRSGELSLYLGPQPQKGRKRDAFSLRDVLLLESRHGSTAIKMPFHVAKENQLGPFLEKLATDTQMYAARALAGDRMYFRRLERFRHAEAEVSMRQMRLRQVRVKAEKAWQLKELEEVASLYGSIEGELTAAEKKRLSYSRKHRHD